MLPHILAVVALMAAPDSGAALHLLPMPAQVTVGTSRMPITGAFAVTTPKFHDGRLDRAVERALKRLESRTGTAYRHAIARDSTFAPFTIVVDGPGQTVQTETEDESYTLTVSDSAARLYAPTVVGAIRGLETFLQLLERDSAGAWLPTVEIRDQPRFPWRGLLIDVSRHWEPVEVIERNLDAMAAVKLNVLHWHLSDDQGFRVESRRFPKLQGMGSDGHFYTQDQIRHIVAYARDRGIRVVPEFDMPGHSTSWFVGYPQYSSGPGPYQIERHFGVFVPTFDPTRDATYRFIERFITEMAALFPDPYWHIGGDEVEGSQWKNNPRIQQFMRVHHLADNDALQAYFNRRLNAILQRHGKRVVGWDEILNPALPKTVVVQSWRGTDALVQSARQGYNGILSAPYYLDAMRSAADHYLADPLPSDTLLTPDQARHILGGEVCMWGELLTPENIDSRIWPRTAAVAERFWSPREVRDVPDMYRRLAFVNVELEGLGLHNIDGAPRMLRRLAGTADIEPLESLLQWIAPVSLGQRARVQPATQQTPLVALGDLARPDPAGAREVSDLIASVLAGGASADSAAAELHHIFAEWRTLAAGVKPFASSSPGLEDVDSVSAVLAHLADIGDEALSRRASGAEPNPDWLAAQSAWLGKAQHPVGLVRVMVVNPVRQLVSSPAQTSQDRRPPP
ncbi:MAG TPA: family 20 glycosylhydrolase [Gemmatimonadales bacterium]|nr:family 20 glycosylhydrolase [Gemmatimonadales bacterium]